MGGMKLWDLCKIISDVRRMSYPPFRTMYVFLEVLPVPARVSKTFDVWCYRLENTLVRLYTATHHLYLLPEA